MMDDLNSRLAEILGDKESMEKVRALAENLLSAEDTEPEEPIQSGDFDPAEISKIMSIVTKLNSSKEDNRTSLLLALKPHVSEKKAKKIDTAVKLLRLIDMLPLLKDSGILDL